MIEDGVALQLMRKIQSESVGGDTFCDFKWAIPTRAQLVTWAISGFRCNKELKMYHDLITDL